MLDRLVTKSLRLAILGLGAVLVVALVVTELPDLRRRMKGIRL